MKLLVIFASLFALGSMTPEQDLSSFEVEYYGEDKGKLKEGKPDANNPVKGNEANPKENIEQEPYGEGKGKLKEGKPEANNPGKGNEANPKENIEEEPYGEGKGKLKEGKPDVDNSGKGNEAKPNEDIEENKLRFQYGEFHELKFGVKGSVWSEDEQVLRIKGFHYDGKGTYTAEVFGSLRY